jgi:flagellin
MSLTLNTNVASLQTQQYLSVNTDNAAAALSQLSSGSALNNASDNPASYAIAYKLSVKSASISTSINNGNQALSMLQVAQGGIKKIGDILIQLKQIATQAASSNTDSDNLPALQTQVSQLEVEINNIASGTQYGGVAVLQGGNSMTMTLAESQAGIESFNVAAANAGAYSIVTTASATGVTLTLSNAAGTSSQAVYVAAGSIPSNGGTGTVNFSQFGVNLTVTGGLTGMASQGFTVTAASSSFSYQVGAENQTYAQISVSISNFSFGNTSGLNLTGSVSSQSLARAFMTQIDTATTWLNSQAGSIGASQNEITYQVANLRNMNTNTQSAASTIKDTDYAAAMSDFTKAQVAQQAGVAMLSQANQLPQQILSLIKG